MVSCTKLSTHATAGQDRTVTVTKQWATGMAPGLVFPGLVFDEELLMCLNRHNCKYGAAWHLASLLALQVALYRPCLKFAHVACF